MALKEQMELFDDGGLKDEGNTIDPVSGNDVPPGSTQEEVRDDIPAQLSEGEFVFPADVVRYIGLEKLMQMRQQAKMGLQTMEDMGQMGNSEEAVMPDNLPFELTDLDMDDEEEYNTDTVEMATGGLTGPATGIAGFVPSQVQPIPSAQQPQAPVTPTVQQPTQTATPIAPTYTPPQQQEVPTFTPEQMQDVSYPGVVQTPEQAPRTVDIINPTTGERRTITYIPGVTQLPEGFVLASEYTAPDAQATSVTPVVGQAQVRKDDDDPSKPDPLKQRRISDRIAAAERMGYTDFLSPIKEVGSVFAPFGIGKGLLEPGKVTGTGYIVMTDGSLFDPMTGKEVSSNVIEEVKNFFTDSEAESPAPFDPEVTSKLPGYADRLKRARENLVKQEAKAEERFLSGLAPDAPKGATQAQKDKAKKEKETVRQIAKEVKEKREKAIKDEAKRTGKTKEDVKAEEEADTLAFNTGGLASKPKPKPKPKPKQMRSGGLASKN